MEFKPIGLNSARGNQLTAGNPPADLSAAGASDVQAPTSCSMAGVVSPGLGGSLLLDSISAGTLTMSMESLLIYDQERAGMPSATTANPGLAVGTAVKGATVKGYNSLTAAYGAVGPIKKGRDEAGLATTAAKQSIFFTQINLQHSKAATGSLSSRLARLQKFPQVVLIQEPWVRHKRICGLGGITWGQLLHCEGSERPRACVIVSNTLEAMMLRPFCSQDIVAVKLSYRLAGTRRDTIVVSAYLPYDSISPPPPRELMEVVRYAESNNLDLIVGCDANAQHTLWGSSKCNYRGEKLLDFISSSDLVVKNVGNKPTFVTSRRTEVIDITICNKRVMDLVTDWRVSGEVSLSDHRYLEFRLAVDHSFVPAGRNPRKADWNRYCELLAMRVGHVPKLRSVESVEEEARKLCLTMTDAFEAACPIRMSRRGYSVPWWNSELQRLRKRSRKLLNRALKTRREDDWDHYRILQREYKRRVKSAKLSSYRSFCEDLMSTRETARLCKILQRDSTAKLNSLVKPDGSYTTSKQETYEVLFGCHFPGCLEVPRDRGLVASPRISATRFDWFIASGVANVAKIRLALSSFHSYKSPGPDGIYPVMLKTGVDILAPALEKTFRACIAHGYVPVEWRKARVVFIPKPGKSDYTLAKSFRPICLTSFMLKCLERLVERHIRGAALRTHPLSDRQHAYRIGRSCESALHDLVTRIEKAVDRKHFALGLFVDIEGAFDSPAFASLCNSAREHGVDETTIRWIHFMLSHRLLLAEDGCGNVTAALAARGCPQGGVLSPFLWCMLLDSLLAESDSLMNTHIQAYADDVCALVVGNCLRTVCSRMQRVLDRIYQWCTARGLTVNPRKTTLVLFTRKRRLDGLTLPSLMGETIQLSTEVKYLGCILDAKLTWKNHVENKVHRALNAFWQCRRTFGKTWGLRPAMAHWLYTAVIRPTVTYASVVWWRRVEVKSTCAILNRLQRDVTIGITGALSTTPGAALDALLNLAPLDLKVQEEAMKAVCRLKRNGSWHGRHASGHSAMFGRLIEQCELFCMPEDYMTPFLMFRRRYEVIYPPRERWADATELLTDFTRIFYTDGSKTPEGTGSGWYLDENSKCSYALGSTATVFQAEVFAVLRAGNWIIDNRWRGMTIGICSDSQAVLRALENPVTESKIVQECKRRLNSVGRYNRICLIWVPGHHGIAGNEASDALAKEGSETTAYGPEPILGVSLAALREWVTRRVATAHAERWSTLASCRHAKRFVKGPDKRLAAYLLGLSRKNCRALVGLITGHNTCGQHMTTMGIISDPTCASCLEDDDTTEHFLCVCPAYSRIRMRVFGTDVTRMDNVCSRPPTELLRFIKLTKKFD